MPCCTMPSLWQYALVALAALASPAFSADSSEPAPMVIAPSQYWEGNDGPWSTFFMTIGSSTNVTRVLPSTLIPNPWVVLTDACNTTACANSRGSNLFDKTKSSTWKDQGLFNLWYESNLNYTGNGDYGLDTVGLGLNPSNASTAKNQLVVGIIADDFWLGYIGVNPQSTNLTNFNDPIPSLIQSFKDNKAIPSLSFSYTAGAQYRNKGVYGQLILGGYDTSRFTSNSLDFNMAEDITRDIVVGIQSLQATETSGKVTNLLSSGILSFVDSSVPWIVLPPDACNTIEQTFGISQDPKTGLYLISDAQHNALTSRAPNFTFVLGNNANGGNTIPITIPYAALDLQIDAPYVQNQTKYFPLKRGNDTTYTLGRAFLQETYLTANYEHMNFSISQAIFDTTIKSSIQPIHALGYVAPPDSGSSSPDSPGSTSPSTFPIGAIIGIVIAVVVIIAIIAMLAFLRHKRRWPFRKQSGPYNMTELDANGNVIGYEKDGTTLLGGRHPSTYKNNARAGFGEADSKDSLHGHYRPELAGTDGATYKQELPGVAVHRPGDSRNELAGHVAANEVEGSPGIVMEMEGSPVGQEYFRSRDRQLSVEHNNKRLSPGLSPQSPSAGSPLLGRGSGQRNSPVSPHTHRGSESEISSARDGLSPASARGSRGRIPVSPQSAGSHHSNSRAGSRQSSQAGSSHGDERTRMI